MRAVDALVVGAGVAGSSAAMALARRGWSVLMIDRRRGPRAKTCGHCLSARADDALRRLDLADAVDALVEARHRTLHIEAAGRILPMSLHSAGRVVRRDRLDPALREVAASTGVELHEGSRILELGASGDGGDRVATIGTPEGSSTIRARLVVGADGLGSAVARLSGLAADRRGSAMGVSFDMHIADTTKGDRLGWPEASAPVPGEVRMIVSPRGYVGIVRESDGRIHGAALLRRGDDRSPAPHAELSAMLAAHVGSEAVGALRLVGASPMPWRPRRIAAPGVALVGDAAGYTEPFTGEGMAWAFESALLLGDAVRGRRFGVDEAAHYAASWRRTIGLAQRRSARIGRLLRHPRLLALAAGTAPSTARRIGEYVARTVVGSTRRARCVSGTAVAS